MARFFIHRPVVAIVISIVTVLLGLLALVGLPVEQFPDIVPPQIIVTGTYTGADAMTVEQSVATPLEQQVNGVDDMLYMQSYSGADGTYTLTVEEETGGGTGGGYALAVTNRSIDDDVSDNTFFTRRV